MIDPGAQIDGSAFVDGDASVGSGSRVERGAMLFAGVVVEDDVYVGPGAILTNERYPRAVTSTLGTGAAAGEVAPPVVVRRGSSIGAGAVVVAGVEVGRSAMVGAGSVVTRTVPNHALVAGNPARRIGWVCACGMRLVDSNGDPAPAEPAHYSLDKALHCPACGRVYTYVPDEETVQEASGPRTEIPA